MAEYPIIFEENKINSDTDILSASTGEATINYCLDYNKHTKYKSYGSNDATQEIITVEFKDASDNAIPQSIDRLILIGINLKQFKLQYDVYLGSVWQGWTDISETIKTTNSENNLIISFTQITAWKVRLVMDKTITANQEKEICEFIVTNVKYTFVNPMEVYRIRNKTKTTIQRMYNGIGQEVYFYDKYASIIEFHQLEKSDRDSLKTIYEEHKRFFWIAEPYNNAGADYKINECYLVNWIGSYDERYYTSITGLGYNINIRLEEV